MWGVFDAARSNEVYAELVRSKLVFRSLYEGMEAARFIDIAPYLVRLDPEHAGIEGLLNSAEGESWAIFLSSQAPLEDVRRHLRKFVKVELEGRKNAVFFRFYDPRVFRDAVPCFEGEQLRRFFDLPDYYLCESEDGSERGIERYCLNGEDLEVTES